MKQGIVWMGVVGIGLFVAGIGCARITTRVEEKPRLDQGMQGNRGVLLGSVPAASPRKTTRQIIRTDVELATGEELNPWRVGKPPEGLASPEPLGSVDEGIPAVVQLPQPAGQTYTVQAGDTLEKIAKRLYGDAGQWQRIYQANRERLRSPDRIYEGQELVIPPPKGRTGRGAGFAGELK